MRKRTSFSALAVVVLAASACVSTTDIENVQGQLSDLQRQVLLVQTQGSSKEEIEALETALAQQTQSLLKSEADMQVDLQNVSSQIERLQAKLEDTNYRLEQLSLQIAATNQALQSQAATSGLPAAAANLGDPQALYQSAYGDYLKKSYDLAIAGFQLYLDSYAETELADNAAYWIGESLYGQGNYEAAIRHFNELSVRFPRSDKTASAGLKKAFAHLELGNRNQGVAELQRLLRDYPNSDEASLARNRLRDLGVDAR
jgi:tol-pal system protein YbgF